MLSPGPDSTSSTLERSPVRRKVASAKCFYCGKPISLLTRLGGEHHFCSAGHRELYHEEMNQLALEALDRNHAAQAASGQEVYLVGQAEFSLAGIIRSRIPGFSQLKPKPALHRICEGCPNTSVANPEITVTIPSLALKAVATGLRDGDMLNWTSVCGRTSTAPFNDTISPLSFISEPHRLPKSEVRPGSLIPDMAAAAQVAHEMVRKDACHVPRHFCEIARPETFFSGLQPMGVDDVDNPLPQPSRSASAHSTPAVIGETLKIRPYRREAINSPLTPRTLPLRIAAETQAPIFVPRLVMRTMRPRVAFGPLPTAWNRATSGFRPILRTSSNRGQLVGNA